MNARKAARLRELKRAAGQSADAALAALPDTTTPANPPETPVPAAPDDTADLLAAAFAGLPATPVLSFEGPERTAIEIPTSVAPWARVQAVAAIASCLDGGRVIFDADFGVGYPRTATGSWRGRPVLAWCHVTATEQLELEAGES